MSSSSIIRKIIADLRRNEVTGLVIIIIALLLGSGGPP